MRRSFRSLVHDRAFALRVVVQAFGTLRFVVVALFFASVAGSSAAIGAGPSDRAFARGHVLVTPRVSSDERSFGNGLAKRNAHSLGKIGHTRVHVVDVAPGTEEQVVASLAADPDVEFAEVDRILAPSALTSDTWSGSEWHLTTIGAATAWSYATGSGVTIAILDSGVDAAHPDLASQIVPGWNFYDNNSNTADVYGHGTVVAGAAAAATNNGIGVASVAGGAKIMPVRISDPSGSAALSTVAQGIDYAADHGARVVNLSFGGASGSPTVQQAAQYLRSKGGVLFVAAGNTGALDSTPPTDLMIVVAATVEDDTTASWSTYGSFVDIAAPGNNIIAPTWDGGYCSCYGTSLATPIVAGTAALILSRRPDFTPAQVDATLKSTATDLGAAGVDIHYGNGRLNAGAALVAAAGAAAPPLTDTSSPTVAIASPVGGTVSGTVTVNVNASDNVGVARVELRVNGSLIASDAAAPYQFAWNTLALANGAVALTAVAYDGAGNSKASAPVTVTVSNTVAPTDTTTPTVSIASPTGGTVTGTVVVSASASDNIGVTHVDLLVNGTVVATTNVSPYRFSWNSTSVPNGTASLTAKAYDAAGNSSVSAAVSVTVSNGTSAGTADTTAPAVKITNPANGAVVKGNGNVTIIARATDNAGSASVTLLLYIDGVLKRTVTAASTSYSWNVKSVASGPHVISATAIDKAGNRATATVTVMRR